MSYMDTNESCHVGMSHVTHGYKYITSRHISRVACARSMSHVTFERAERERASEEGRVEV